MNSVIKQIFAESLFYKPYLIHKEERSQTSWVLWALVGIVLCASTASSILIWPFQCKRQFYSSGCPVNSISKGQKSGDCGLDEKQKCMVSFLSPSNRDHSELVGWPSFWFSVLWEPGDGTDRTGGTEADSESNHACPLGLLDTESLFTCEKHPGVLPDHRQLHPEF